MNKDQDTVQSKQDEIEQFKMSNRTKLNLKVQISNFGNKSDKVLKSEALANLSKIMGKFDMKLGKKDSAKLLDKEILKIKKRKELSEQHQGSSILDVPFVGPLNKGVAEKNAELALEREEKAKEKKRLKDIER